MRVMVGMVAAIGLWLASGAQAQPAAAPAPAPTVQTILQTTDQSFAQDAATYADRHGVPLDEALRRVRAQEASVLATDALRTRFGERLAGISIEHSPAYRIVVLLTGDDPVPDEQISTGGMLVPLHFTTGARASERAVVLALRVHQAALRTELPGARGMGFDPRSGALVMIFNQVDIERLGGAPKIAERASLLTGVPVSVRAADGRDVNMVVAGGGRIEGVSSTGGRARCTSGFVVGDGTRTGLATAAHCPDAVTYYDPDGGTVSLDLAGSWGARVQDIQINVSPVPLQPLFYADRAPGSLRPNSLRTVTSWRNAGSTRAGDMVCHWGESTGYSCGEVQLTHFAPPGELCGGPCEPSWVTVATTSCHGGDSGGPVFVGTTAFGIVKGGNRDHDGGCNFYYYMSTDYLPGDWRLLHGADSGAPPSSGGLPRRRLSR